MLGGSFAIGRLELLTLAVTPSTDLETFGLRRSGGRAGVLRGTFS